MLFQRAYSLAFGATPINTLDISFECRRTDGGEPNKLDLTVYNLSQDTRALLKQGIPLSLEVGYGTETGIVFNGNIKKVTHTKDGVEWLTSIEGTEGGRAASISNISKSYAQNTSVQQLVDDIASQLPFAPSKATSAIVAAYRDKQITDFANGFVARGKPFRILSTIARGAGLKLSIQNGELLALRPNESSTASAVLLAPSTGLVGSPSVAEDGDIVVTSLMNAQIVPGRLIQVQSVEVEGVYKARTCVYRGSNDDAQEPWEVEINGRDIN